MKKIATTFCIALFIVCGYGQNIVLFDVNKNVISNTFVDINVPPNSSVSTEILINNTKTIPDTIKVARIIYTKDSADLTTFCLGGLCYAYTTSLSSLSLTIPSGDTVNFAGNGFHSVFNTDAACVTRLVHYKFYNIHNFSDSTGVTLRYLCATGINELSKEAGVIGNAYPNPANSLVSINYNVNEFSEKGKLVFYDMLGKSVKEITLNDKQGVAKINIADLNAGIYFYTLIVNDKAISTKKLVISF